MTTTPIKTALRAPSGSSLRDLLPFVLQHLGDIGCGHVDITRKGDRRPQLRFRPGKPDPYIETRLWMDGTQETPTRGTRKGYVGWTLWSRFMGFSLADVLAGDWIIVP